MSLPLDTPSTKKISQPVFPRRSASTTKPLTLLMETTTLHIKNMVCPRCIRVVREELEKIGVQVIALDLGWATVGTEGEYLKKGLIEHVLVESGFELIKDRWQEMTEQIKVLIVKLIHHNDPPHMYSNYSNFIAEQLGKDYQYLSQIFSSHEGVTLEKFIILQKVERAKELLSYGQLPIGQIARELGYSSLAHFSNQFKQQTGHTPSAYKRLDYPFRKGLDHVC